MSTTGSYSLKSLLRAPISGDDVGGERSLACRTGVDGGCEVDRVCAARGGAVHLITLQHDGATGQGKKPSPRVVQVEMEENTTAECFSWNSSASFLALGDSTGALHLLMPDGTFLYSQQLEHARNSEQPVFSAIAFACPSSTFTSPATEELVAVTSSGKLYFIGNLSLVGLQVAAMANPPDADAVKALKSAISVDVVQLPGSSGACASIALQWSPQETVVYVACPAGLFVWRRQRGPGNKLVLDCGVHAAPGQAFGDGEPRCVQLSSDGLYLVVSDTSGGVTWWDAVELLRIRRWKWDSGDLIESMVLLPQDGHGGGFCLACIVSRQGAPCAYARIIQFHLRTEECVQANDVPIGSALSVPSPASHRFLLLTVSDGHVNLMEGREAVPLQRMRALISKHCFEDALRLAEEHEMDSEEIHLAHLVFLTNSLSGETSSASAAALLAQAGELLRRLRDPEALSKCAAAIESATYPTVGEARSFLQLLQKHLRSLALTIKVSREQLLPSVSDVLQRLGTYESLVDCSSGKGMRGWDQFRRCHLEDLMAQCLQAGEVFAAATIWRRHAITHSMKGVTQITASLPQALHLLPANNILGIDALAVWLREDVMPSLSVSAASEVRHWGEQYSRAVEASAKRPHSALLVARAVIEGSRPVLGAAATALTPLTQWADWDKDKAESSCLGGEDVPPVPGAGLAEDHWKLDGLDALILELQDLVYAWDGHQLCLPLAEFENLSRTEAIFRVLDRVQSPILLPQEIEHHAIPLSKRYHLNADEVLFQYVKTCSETIVGRRQKGGDFTTEQRAVAVVRQMSGTCNSDGFDTRSAAVLSLARAVTFPFSPELWQLAQDSLSWRGALEDELAEAARILSLAQIVQRHRVTDFSLVDPSHATRLVRHVASQVCCEVALEDSLEVARAYSHISERGVYVDFLQNLAVTPRRDDGAAAGSAPPLVAHSARIVKVLESISPVPEAMIIAQDVLLFALRTLEDLALDAKDAGLPAGALEGSAGSLCPDKLGVDLVTPGSDAEEAMFASSAASVIATWLRDTEAAGGHNGDQSRKSPLHLPIAELVPALRKLTSLETEFGLFPSLHVMLHKRGAVNVGLALIKAHLNKEKAQGGCDLQRVRRLADLLSIPWPRVIGYMAREAARRGLVSEALALCETLFSGRAAVDEASSALALRDAAVALSTFIAEKAKAGALTDDEDANGKNREAVLQAAAHSLLGLRESVTMCHASELSKTLDLLQGADLVVNIISRCSEGESFSSLLSCNWRSTGGGVHDAVNIYGGKWSIPSLLSGEAVLAPNFTAAPTGKGKGKGKQQAREPAVKYGSTLEAPENVQHGYHQLWFRGGGLVLPLQESLQVACDFVLQEMKFRQAAAAGVVMPSSLVQSHALATGRLCEFLADNGAQQAVIRVLELLSLPSPESIPYLHESLSNIVGKVLSSRQLDGHLAIGYMLSLPRPSEVMTIYRRALPAFQTDFGRLRLLAALGMELARAWQNHDMLAECSDLERDSHWWHVLTSFNIPFEPSRFRDTQKQLVPLLLERSGGDLALTLEYCEQYHIPEHLPCLLYVEQQLTQVPKSPHDLSYQDAVKGVLGDVQEHHVVHLLKHLLKSTSPTAVHDWDYEKLSFMYELLCQRTDVEEQRDDCKRALAALGVLKGFRSPWPLEAKGEEVGSLGAKKPHEIYSHRLPFRPLLADPWPILTPFLVPDMVVKLVALARPLRIEVGEMYFRLVQGMFGEAHCSSSSLLKMGAGTVMPSWESVFAWLEKVRPASRACWAGQWVASRLRTQAATEKALEFTILQAKAAVDEGVNKLRLLPLVLRKGGEEEDAGESTSEVSADKVCRILKNRLMELRHLITIEALLGTPYVDILAPWLAANAEDLLLHLYANAAKRAAETAQQGGSMDAFRSAAGAAYRAAMSIAEQRGFDSHEIEAVRQKLARMWIFSASSNDEASSAAGIGSYSVFSSLGGGGLLGDGIGSSVFDMVAREKADAADTFAALQIAFVSSVTSSYEEDGASDYIISMDLKTNVDNLLGIGHESRGGKVTFRARLRALLAIALIAPRQMIAQVYATGRWEGNCLGDLSRYVRHIGYMAEFEAMRLPQQFDDLLVSDKVALVRSLLRDHSDVQRLPYLLCSMLLDDELSACAADAQLWRTLLSCMERNGMQRELLLHVLPKLAHSPARGGASALPSAWKSAIFRPLEELSQRHDRMEKAKKSAKSVALPSSSLSYSASLFGDSGDRGASDGVSVPANDASILEISETVAGLPCDKVNYIIEAVIFCLRCCPVIEEIDVRECVRLLVRLGPSQHPHAIQCALCEPLPALRRDILVEICLAQEVSAVMVLDSMGGSGSGDNSGWNSWLSQNVVVEGIFDALEDQRRHADLMGTPHFGRFVGYLVQQGKAQELMRLCLTSKRTGEAEKLAQMHYRLHGDNEDDETKSALERYCSANAICLM
jgi:hypothetical protein